MEVDPNIQRALAGQVDIAAELIREADLGIVASRRLRP
jgi:hypothetical protein